MLFIRNRYFVGRYVTTVSVLASLKVLSDGSGGDKIETQKLKALMAFIHVCTFISFQIVHHECNNLIHYIFPSFNMILFTYRLTVYWVKYCSDQYDLVCLPTYTMPMPMPIP